MHPDVIYGIYWQLMAYISIIFYMFVHVFVAKNQHEKPAARLSRHSDATRIGETLGTYRATSSTLRAKRPRRSSRSTNALVGTLARIGWQQVWQGRFATWHLKIVWVDVFFWVFWTVFGAFEFEHPWLLKMHPEVDRCDGIQNMAKL